MIYVYIFHHFATIILQTLDGMQDLLIQDKIESWLEDNQVMGFDDGDLIAISDKYLHLFTPITKEN